MENNDRTLKELATPDVVYQPWCIQYQQLEPALTYGLKSDLRNLLHKFHGLAGEDPHKHLKEFHVVCSIMRLQGILEDYIKMKVFHFPLTELHRIGCIYNRSDDDGPNINGQDASNKAPDLQYDKQYTIVWDQRSWATTDGQRNRCSRQPEAGESID
ncbi:hypothetical protein CR513_16318, partial [Mucuna pruriens]